MTHVAIICVKNYDAFACTMAEKLQAAADAAGLDWEVTSLTTAEIHRLKAADLILFAPPRYRAIDRLKEKFPSAAIGMIEMRAYSQADGAAVLEFARRLLNFGMRE